MTRGLAAARAGRPRVRRGRRSDRRIHARLPQRRRRRRLGLGVPLACAGVYPPVEVATPHVDPAAAWGRSGGGGGGAFCEEVLDVAQRLSAAGAAAAGRVAARGFSLAEGMWSPTWHGCMWGLGG